MKAAEDLYLEKTHFEMAEVVYKFELGKPMVASHDDYKKLSTNMRQLHDYYIIDSNNGKEKNAYFEVCIPSCLFFNHPEEVVHTIPYEELFQLYQRRSLDLQILMIWTL